MTQRARVCVCRHSERHLISNTKKMAKADIKDRRQEGEMVQEER